MARGERSVLASGVLHGMPRLALLTYLAIFLSANVSAPADEQNAVTVKDWTVAKSGGTFAAERDLLRVSGDRGWVRSRTEFTDFTLRLEYRLVKPGSEAAVLLRAWPERPNAWPLTGYRVSIRESSVGKDAVGTISSYLRKISIAGTPVLRPPRDASPSGEWQTFEVQCERDRLTVRLNGAVINVVDGAETLAGYIGIAAAGGTVEFRNIQVIQSPGLVCSSARPAGEPQIAILPSPGIVAPRVAQQARPRYTMEAMTRHVQGTAVVQAVVMADGSVRDACISRSLDPDLDAEAVAAATRWQFTPAIRNGEPVPVMVTIELTFTLKY